MPELPEVETIKRYLTLHMINERINHLEIFYPKAVECANDITVDSIKEQRILFVSRRGKYLHIGLEDYELVIHLRMTGQLYFQPSTPPKDHLRWILHLNEDSKLYFRDVRKFGRLFIYNKGEARFLSKGEIGPEPWQISLKHWQDKLQSTRSIKVLLLSQDIIAGIGNIYADEALYLASIHPEKKGRDLSLKEIENLASAVRTVLDRGIRFGGTSFRDYLGGDGKKGEMQEHLNVYQKNGSACIRCKTFIERIKVGGRSSHFCPSCQSLE